MRLNQRFRGFLPIVVDLETGGVEPEKHAVLELAIVFLNWNQDRLVIGNSHTWSIVPHEQTEVDEESLRMNQIDPFNPDRVAQSEEHSIRECFRAVRRVLKDERCERALLTGHNAHFDRKFLSVATKRNGIGQDPFHPFTVVDTASLSAVAYGHTVLKIACERAGVHFNTEKAHSAQYDANVTAQLFCSIVNRSTFVHEYDQLVRNT